MSNEQNSRIRLGLNLFDQVKDLNKEYELDVKVVSFKEIICEPLFGRIRICFGRVWTP